MANNEEQNFEELYESSLKKLQEGTIVKGVIINIVNDEIFVDLGYKSDGIIPKEEFSYEDEKPIDVYKIGDEINVYILKMNDGQGNVLLSTKKLQQKRLKEEFEKSVKEGKSIKVKVCDIVNGGVIAKNGAIKIFIPQTQLAEKVADLSVYMGRQLEIKIIEYDLEKRKIIGSERKLLDEKREELSNETWGNIAIGKTIEGTVKQLNNYGAFVDIGGVDGLLHISEISWKQIKHPSEVLKIGQVILVTIISIDKENKKIALRYRKDEDNPWNNMSYKVGDVVKAKVVSMKPFGAFVELEDGIEGLVHISNITEKRITKPQEILKIDQMVDAKILEIDMDKKRMELSIRELEGLGNKEDVENLINNQEKLDEDSNSSSEFIGQLDFLGTQLEKKEEEDTKLEQE